MNVAFRESFVQDLQAVRDKAIRARVEQLIEQVEQASRLDEISHVKRLRSAGRSYRIRIGDYRVGITLDGNTVTFVRFLHRKDIYRYFP